MAASTTPYQFSLISPVINTENFPLKSIHRVVTLDDIFKFYSYMEINFNDEAGVILGIAVCAEGVLASSKLGLTGSGKEDWLECEWVWDTNQVVDVRKTNFISGDSIISFFSHYYLNDAVKSRAWKDTSSNIFKDILKKDFGLTDTTKIFVTETKDVNYYYQINETNSKFLTRLAERAYSSEWEYSPFVTFTNCLGEIYFCAIEYLFNREVINDKPYKLSNDKDTAINFYSIKDIEFLYSGLTVNKPNYKKKIYRQQMTGVIENEATDISNHTIKVDSGNVLIRKNNLLLQNTALNDKDIFDSKDFGIYNGTTDDGMFRGYRNGLYFNSLLYLRLKIVIRFNPKAATGKLINIELGSNIKERNDRLSELCGKWLIISCQHYFDGDGEPSTNLELAKNKTVVDPTNIFKNDFI